MRFLIGIYQSAILATDHLDLSRLITALKDTPRRRQRQALLLC